jgi:bifunctional DNA-binding transcriptional regulator/antitoxin component of YhaV-PrlF toxin-antitoxin module
MERIKMSPAYKVEVTDTNTLVIPQAILDAFGIQPGQQYQVIQYGERIELIPILPPEQAEGFLRGINTEIDDEDDSES